MSKEKKISGVRRAIRGVQFSYYNNRVFFDTNDLNLYMSVIIEEKLNHRVIEHIWNDFLSMVKE